MTYEEYEASVNKMVEDPEKIGEAAAELLKELKADTDLFVAAQAKVAELTTKNNELNKTIFMSTLGKPTEAPAPESEEPLSFDELMDKYGKETEDDGNS